MTNQLVSVTHPMRDKGWPEFWPLIDGSEGRIWVENRLHIVLCSISLDQFSCQCERDINRMSCIDIKQTYLDARRTASYGGLFLGSCLRQVVLELTPVSSRNQHNLERTVFALSNLTNRERDDSRFSGFSSPDRTPIPPLPRPAREAETIFLSGRLRDRRYQFRRRKGCRALQSHMCTLHNNPAAVDIYHRCAVTDKCGRCSDWLMRQRGSGFYVIETN
jgi:hypothetical protein